ncbi:hypothetical protein BV22DRAFT_170632 [Leucogyrophana mollusca]|uniref:Uncharacterized protein n=1 Tax=Leucogyrophana mollusca TaxID=85980 RepID=A0ACB8BT60_9AGAM|nr:hypothetical protein BV22DRAFT_170632 [Leucogyrophana mollusca]
MTVLTETQIRRVDISMGATVLTLDTLPVDVLYQIINHLDVEDIIYLGQVSKQFHQISWQRTTWLNAYRHSLLPRPPGPHSWHSTQYLRDTLVRSAKVAKKWPSADADPLARGQPETSPPSKPVSLRTIDLLDTGVDVVAGRWLVRKTCQREIWALDLDSGDGQGSEQLLFHCDTSMTIEHFLCTHTVDAEGNLLAFLVVATNKQQILSGESEISIFKLNRPEFGREGFDRSDGCFDVSLIRSISLGDSGGWYTLYNIILRHTLVIQTFDDSIWVMDTAAPY